jgi:hypothetical protein
MEQALDPVFFHVEQQEHTAEKQGARSDYCTLLTGFCVIRAAIVRPSTEIDGQPAGSATLSPLNNSGFDVSAL